jgi:CheY-specific phosphatase CheX
MTSELTNGAVMNNENGAVCDTVEEIFHQANNELFSGYKLEFLSSSRSQSAQEQDIQGDSIMSVLTAAGEGIKILSAIKLSAETAAYIHPTQSAAPEDLQDLCGELNNQLVGKVKNKLLAYDCKLMLGLPSFISGSNLSSHSVPNANLTERIYCSAVGNVIVCLHVVIHPDFTMLDVPNEELTGEVSEGMLSFF